VGEITRILGLDRSPPFHQDGLFLTVLLAGGVFWLSLWLCLPVQPIALRQVFSWAFLSLTLWQPCAEELAFRGVLQGQLSQQAWGHRTWGRLTLANLVTSLVFVLGHWWRHPPLWAMAVVLPSLIFGSVRDRYTSVYPAMALHMFYNVGYFVLTGLP